MTGHLIKEGNLGIDMHSEKKPCEHEGKDQGDASRGQGMPNHQHLGGRPGTDSPLYVPEATSTDDTWISDS